MYTVLGDLSGTVRGQFTSRRENSPLQTPWSNRLVNPGHQPPVMLARWRAGGEKVNFPGALAGLTIREHHTGNR